MAWHFWMLAVLTFISSVQSVIEESPMPIEMNDCFQRYSARTSLSKTVGQSIDWFCVDQYLWKNAKYNGYQGFNMTTATIDWFNRLTEHPTHRNKRQSLRLRKEYRMLEDFERANFHRAIQMLKSDTSVSPNRYDALAGFHSGLASVSAHGGPTFLGWHRVYLLMFENALREMIPDVTVPYWDSTLDDESMNPTMSIMWTGEFLGNGNGLVTSGPFAFWRTPSGPLTRNIATSGQLMRSFNVQNIINKFRLTDISEPTANVDSNLEFHHGGVHIWVDGQMGSLNTAAQDPVFWVHHAFIDYVWELFRRNQRMNGVDPSNDYPTIVNNTMHAAMAPLGLANMRNIDGLGEQFTSQIYRYESLPTCNIDFPNCGSTFLRCELQGFPRCVPVDQFSVNRQNTVNRQNNQFGQNGAGQANPGWNQNNFNNFGGTNTNNFGSGIPAGTNVNNNFGAAARNDNFVQNVPNPALGPTRGQMNSAQVFDSQMNNPALGPTRGQMNSAQVFDSQMNNPALGPTRDQMNSAQVFDSQMNNPELRPTGGQINSAQVFDSQMNNPQLGPTGGQMNSAQVFDSQMNNPELRPTGGQMNSAQVFDSPMNNPQLGPTGGQMNSAQVFDSQMNNPELRPTGGQMNSAQVFDSQMNNPQLGPTGGQMNSAQVFDSQMNNPELRPTGGQMNSAQVFDSQMNNPQLGPTGGQMNSAQVFDSQMNNPVPNTNGMMQMGKNGGNVQNGNMLSPPPLPSASFNVIDRMNQMPNVQQGNMPVDFMLNANMQPNFDISQQNSWTQNTMTRNSMTEQFPSQVNAGMAGADSSRFPMQGHFQASEGMANNPMFATNNIGHNQPGLSQLPPGVVPTRVVTGHHGRTYGGKQGRYYVKRSANFPPPTHQTGSNAVPDMQRQEQCPAIPFDRAYQNTFAINGVSDMKQWAYIPVKIFFRRPPDFKGYHGYPIINGEVSSQSDIFSTSGFKNLQQHITNGHPASFSRCDAGQHGVGKIFVKSNGINYMGTFKEFAVVDNRLALSISTTYIGIKNPGHGMTVSHLSASDSCGRMCRPYCKVQGSNPQRSRPCSGIVRMTSKTPHMYGINYAEAVLGVWNFSPKSNCPRFNDDNVFLTFYCDYGDRWPWPSENNPVTPQQSQNTQPPLSPFVPVVGPSAGTPTRPTTPVLSPDIPSTCNLGHGCLIPGNCTNICQANSIKECAGTCGTYARCYMGMYHVEKCPMKGRMDVESGTCTPLDCMDEDSITFFNPYA